LLLVERYFSPQQWDDSRVGVHVEVGALTASQYHASRRHGPRADLHVHYVLAEPGSVIAHDEHFRVGLFTEQDYAAAFDAAGLCHRTLLPDALTGRGLHVASRTPLTAREDRRQGRRDAFAAAGDRSLHRSGERP